MVDTLSIKHIYFDLLERIQKNESCVVATVTGTHGSTPQKQGSTVIIGKDGICAGTVGGGVVEMEIEKIGMGAVGTKKTGYYRFDLNHDISEENAAICGGGMNIFLDASPEKHKVIFEMVRKATINRIPGVLVTSCITNSGKNVSVERFWLTKENFSNESKNLSGEISEVAEIMLLNQIPDEFREITFKSTEEAEQLVFLESITPLPKLIIAGAGHVGTALSHLGKLLDFEVTVWDDRTEFANKKHLPDAHQILSGNMEDSLGKLDVDRDTFIVIATRGHKKDADVLRKFINSGAGYIGMIGSRRKIEFVHESFMINGWAAQEQWNKIYSPVGLDIQAKTVQEIAVSIAAQLILVRNQLKKWNG